MLIKVGIIGFVVLLVDVFLETTMLHVSSTTIPLFKIVNVRYNFRNLFFKMQIK